MTEALEEELRRKRELLGLKENTPQAKLEAVFHQKVSGKYLSDAVFGANDGIITTFAVIAGAEGASLGSWVIIVLGCANLLADGISMGVGNYLGKKSEIDYQKKQRQKEAWEVENFPVIEREEIREIFEEKGFAGKDLERAVEIITSDKERWIDMMMLEELKIIEEPEETPAKRGVVTFVAFVIAGAIPLLPFVFGVSEVSRFLVASAATGLTLFVVGALRSRVIIKNWFFAGLEILIVGALAGAAAYGIGAFLRAVIPVTIG